MNEEFRILVCGGRDYGYWHNPETGKKEKYQPEIDHIWHTLDVVRSAISRPIVIIEGEQRGADLFAREWAEERNIEVRGFPADWDKYQKRAGFIRNDQMLKEGKPHAVVAFPGGNGTRMMVRLARRAGIPVKEFYPKWLTSMPS
jgi:hypothetical protein